MAVKEGCTSICFEPGICPAASFLPCRGQRGFPVHQETGNRCHGTLPGCRCPLRAETPADHPRRLPCMQSCPEIALLHKDGLAECMVENPGTAQAIRIAHPRHRPVRCCRASISSTTARPATSPRSSGPSRSHRNCPGTNAGTSSVLHVGRAAATPFALIVQGISEAMITEDCLLEPVRHCRADRATSGKTQHSSVSGMQPGTSSRFVPMANAGPGSAMQWRPVLSTTCPRSGRPVSAKS